MEEICLFWQVADIFEADSCNPQDIVNTFLRPNSDLEVNLDVRERQRVIDQVRCDSSSVQVATATSTARSYGDVWDSTLFMKLKAEAETFILNANILAIFEEREGTLLKECSKSDSGKHAERVHAQKFLAVLLMEPANFEVVYALLRIALAGSCAKEEEQDVVSSIVELGLVHKVSFHLCPRIFDPFLTGAVTLLCVCLCT